MKWTRLGIVAVLALAAIAIIVHQRSRSAPRRVAARKSWPAASVLRYDVVHDYPHDADAYTQGLIYHDGFLYESTGRTFRSSVRKVRLETGEVIQRRDIRRDFGEGLTEWRGRLIQLTPRRRGTAAPWRVGEAFDDVKKHFGNKIGVIYDIASLEPLKSFEYSGEGWGLTQDGHRLIMSDGSFNLRFLDPERFTEVGSIEVFDGNTPIENLNELEFVQGRIYANVLSQDRIAIIEPDTGQITSWIDLAELRARMPKLPTEPLSPVMNGIAYDAEGGRLFVTGKFWPKVFEIRARPGQQAR